MKKFLSILMSAAMLLSVCALSACGGSEEPAPEAEGTEVTEPAAGADLAGLMAQMIADAGIADYIEVPVENLTNVYGIDAAQVVNAAGEVQEFTKEELEGSYVYIEGFQSYTLPVLFNPTTGAKVVDFDHLMTDNEMVISIITEQSRRCMDMFEMVGWDTTIATYHVMATDKFFVPATPVDYDDGEIRGALSGSVNGTFPEMVPAQGKINDVIYVEKVVN